MGNYIACCGQIHFQNAYGAFLFSPCTTPGGCVKCFKYLGTTNNLPAGHAASWNGGSLSMTSIGAFNSCSDCEQAGINHMANLQSPCTAYGCTDPTAMNYNSTILPNCDQGCVYAYQLGCTDSTASNYDPAAIYDDGSCITAAGGCDPSAWSNHANWTSTFTNTVNNANNTCNFLNIKIAQFTSQIPNVGPVWANQLQCKLDLANQLHTQNNC
jgi:hypothetical protein